MALSANIPSSGRQTESSSCFSRTASRSDFKFNYDIFTIDVAGGAFGN
jgi:hypothetical protein